MFVRNSWYTAAWSDELGDEPLGLVLLKQPIVLFRQSDGTVVALEDRCVHRRVPLSMGKVVGDRIQCIYHGFVYDCTGACTKIPGQTRVPPRARVKSYPARERFGCIFVWMGDPERADESRIPDFHWLTAPGSSVIKRHVHVHANYQLVIDNLLDLSHLAFLHASTVGQEELADKADVKTNVNGNKVRVSRWTLDVPAVRTYLQFGRYNGNNIDRWQISEFMPPCFFVIDNGSALAGTGAPEGKPGQKRWGFHVCHGITPETETTTHYFWTLAHEFKGAEEEIAEFYRQNYSVVGEDIAVFEAQQRLIDLDPGAKVVDFKYDVGPLEARKIMKRLLAEEAATA